jgi:hypothetical protein
MLSLPSGFICVQMRPFAFFLIGVLDCRLSYSNAGRIANSSRGTPSTGKPAFTQARNPPLMTVTRIPFP